MAKPLSDHDRAVELLKVALAGLGEQLADEAPRLWPKPRAAQRGAADALALVAQDGHILAEALGVFMRRPRLLG